MKKCHIKLLRLYYSSLLSTNFQDLHVSSHLQKRQTYDLQLTSITQVITLLQQDHIRRQRKWFWNTVSERRNVQVTAFILWLSFTFVLMEESIKFYVQLLLEGKSQVCQRLYSSARTDLENHRRNTTLKKDRQEESRHHLLR